MKTRKKSLEQVHYKFMYSEFNIKWRGFSIDCYQHKDDSTKLCLTLEKNNRERFREFINRDEYKRINDKMWPISQRDDSSLDNLDRFCQRFFGFSIYEVPQNAAARDAQLLSNI